MNVQQSITRASIAYWRAKAEHDALDAISRTRSLTEAESVQLERAINRMIEWEGKAA